MNKVISRQLFSFFLFLSLSFSAFSQDGESSKSIQWILGATHHRLIDQSFTQQKIKFTGTTFDMQLAYQNKAPKFRINGYGQFTSGKASSENIKLRPQLYVIQFTGSYTRRLAEYQVLHKNTRLFIGPQLSMFDYALFDEDIVENVSINFNYSIDLLIIQSMQLNDKSYLDVQIALPVFGWQKKESSDGGANTQLEDDYLNSPGRFLFSGAEASFRDPLSLFRLRVDYSFSISPKTELSVNYLFNYIRDKESPTYRMYENGLLAGFKFKF